MSIIALTTHGHKTSYPNPPWGTLFGNQNIWNACQTLIISLHKEVKTLSLNRLFNSHYHYCQQTIPIK